MQDIKPADGAAEKAAAEAKAKADADAKAKADASAAAAAQGEKVSELFGGKKEEKTVTLRESEFLEFKNDNKALKTEMTKLQDMIAKGLTRNEVSEKLKEIGTKYKVDPNFLKEVSDAIKADSDAEVEKKIAERVKPIEEKEKKEEKSSEADRIDKIFRENFTKTINAMPDFKDVADPDVIKSLTLDPANRDKTFAQIIEKAYGHLVKSKGKTLDESKGGGKEPAGIDYGRAAKDPDYFKTIMADPAQRKEYNSNLHKRLRL